MDLKKDDFIEETIKFFDGVNNNGVDSFMDICVLGQMKQTVENNANVFTERKNFMPEEISVMKEKTSAINNINYVLPEKNDNNQNIFKIKIGDTTTIDFSNRSAEHYEMRGQLLRDSLDKLKKISPEITLYEALTELVIKNPETMTMGFYSTRLHNLHLNFQSPFRPPNLPTPEAGKYHQKKEVVVNALTTLSIACINYITEKEKLGHKREELAAELKNIITDNKKEIFQLILDNTKSEKDILQFIKNNTPDIKQAEKWINEVRDLKKNYSNEQKKIENVAEAAEKLLEQYKSQNPLQKDSQKSYNTATIQKLNETINEAQKLHIEKFTKKSILNVFFFIPGLINLIKEAATTNKQQRRPSWISSALLLKEEDKAINKKLSQKPEILKEEQTNQRALT